MLFLIAFLIGSLGVALLVVGGFRFRGRQISSRAARRIGAVLAGFMPAFLLIYMAILFFDPQSGAYGWVFFLIVAIIDLGIAAHLLRKAMKE